MDTAFHELLQVEVRDDGRGRRLGAARVNRHVAQADGAELNGAAKLDHVVAVFGVPPPRDVLDQSHSLEVEPGGRFEIDRWKLLFDVPVVPVLRRLEPHPDPGDLE